MSEYVTMSTILRVSLVGPSVCNKVGVRLKHNGNYVYHLLAFKSSTSWTSDSNILRAKRIFWNLGREARLFRDKENIFEIKNSIEYTFYL
jgi:hypothetical protein